MGRKAKNANYDYKSQKQPVTPMGQGSFANMPEEPIMRPYGQAASYRDGIINSFSSNITDTSEIHENER